MTVRFLRHGGICRPMNGLLNHLGRSTAPRPGSTQAASKDAPEFYALLIVATSTGRLFLSGLLASIARLRFTDLIRLNLLPARMESFTIER